MAVKHIQLTAPNALHCRVQLPLSKSLSNRTLLIAALQGDDVAQWRDAVAQCDDTAAMLNALLSREATVNVGPAGTAMRFLTAYFAAQPGRHVVIDGSERMRQRPIAPLVDALRQAGASISYLERTGFPPLAIEGKALRTTAPVEIDGSVSSQFTSALLMLAPCVGGMTLRLKGDVASRPYIDMTLRLMEQCGAVVHRHGDHEIVVEEGQYYIEPRPVEADWSAASYWLAWQALLPQSSIVLTGLDNDSLQGDRRALDLVHRLGVDAQWRNGDLELSCTRKVKLARFEEDFSPTPDLAQTFAVLLCLRGIPFTLTGLSTLRIKETDRIAALQTELAKLGYTLHAGNDYLEWNGAFTPKCRCVAIDTHDDHRMAMAMSLAAARFDGVIINDPGVVTKSYPLYWNQLSNSGFQLY